MFFCAPLQVAKCQPTHKNLFTHGQDNRTLRVMHVLDILFGSIFSLVPSYLLVWTHSLSSFFLFFFFFILVFNLSSLFVLFDCISPIREELLV